MNPSKSLSWKTVVAIAMLAAALPALAQKRRAVEHPSPPGPATTVVFSGTVIDAVTSQPVVFAEVRLLNRSDKTDRSGKFKITTTIYGTVNATIARSGYVAGTQAVAATQDVTIRLQPTPTVTLRLTSGETHQLDFESLEFGFVPPFGSYNKSENDDFCKPNGALVTLNRADFARITGPAVAESNSSCCTSGTVQRINAQLKSGETTPLFFVDSCNGYAIDFIGRDHVSGNFVYSKFTDIAEITFP